MRGFAFTLAILIALPPVSALSVPHAHPPPRATSPPLPLPQELSDGDLVRILAAHSGYHPIAPTFVVPPGATLPALVTKLAARAGAAVPPAEAAKFGTLDARVQAPALALLAAVDQAWDLRDQAFARLSRADQKELASLIQTRLDARSTQTSPREAQLAAMIDKQTLFAAAILLLDTIDNTVTPLTQQAVAAGAWPATAPADSVGVLRIGGTGNDVETLDRIVQIDPAGNDTYYNRAGATTLLDDLNPSTLDYNVAVSLDYAGNDTYSNLYEGAQGFGGFGVGVLKDYAGNDSYTCGSACQGSDTAGFGILHDYSGSDYYSSGFLANGCGYFLAVQRDDAGSDSYSVQWFSGGISDQDEGTGLLWDRGGRDTYAIAYNSDATYGWTFEGGRGWFVDEGPELDTYGAQRPLQHTCNDCTWIAGVPGPLSNANGRGNDNRGGLAELLSEDGALFR